MVESPDADRILVIRLGALGDVVRTIPAVASLRAHYPGALITWLVEPAAASALEGQAVVDEVMIFPRDRLQAHLARLRPVSLLRQTLRFARTLREGRFDLVVDFHGILKSGILARLSGAPLRVGYAPPVGREQSWRFANRRALLSAGKRSRFERNEGLVRFLAVAPAAVFQSRLRLEPEAARRAEQQREQAVVVIHPGTSPATPYKRYTAEGYAEAARLLYERAGVRSLVSHGPAPGELEFAQRIVAASRGAAALAPDTPRFADLAELVAGARVFIGSDSGPLHVASLLGTPVVQLLGPTDPVENAPFAGTPSRSVRVPVACSPCRRGCAAATCMRVIPSEAVAAAALELLQPKSFESDAAAGTDSAAGCEISAREAGSGPPLHARAEPNRQPGDQAADRPSDRPTEPPTDRPTGSAAVRPAAH